MLRTRHGRACQLFRGVSTRFPARALRQGQWPDGPLHARVPRQTPRASRDPALIPPARESTRSMGRKKRQRNFLQPREGVQPENLGRLVAEDDRDLERYYVEPERYVDRALNVDDPALFFMGPKGVGKSAILQMVRIRREADSKRLINISPDDLAFSGLANIQAETPLLAEPTKSQWVFKSLWDYILCVEVLKRECQSQDRLVSFLKNIFPSKDEKAAQKLIKITVRDEGSPDSFTERILSLVRAVEATASAMGVDVSLKHKGEPGGKQLQLLSQINHVARTISDRLEHSYYVLIDDLDLHWVDTPTQNAFIAALFLSLRGLSKPPRLKFLVAIRDDIFRRLPLPDKDKIRERICRIVWDKRSINKMLTARLHATYDCTVPEIWTELFPHNAFETMWSHSTGKPRELIHLAALCTLEALAADKKCVGSDDIAAAIIQFSNERLEDLASEKRHLWPGLDQLVRRCRGWPKEFPASKLDDLALKAAEEVESKPHGSSLYSWAAGHLDDPLALGRILAECGILLVKASRTSKPHPFDPDSPEELTNDHWFAFHRMYAPALQLVGD